MSRGRSVPEADDEGWGLAIHLTARDRQVAPVRAVRQGLNAHRLVHRPRQSLARRDGITGEELSTPKQKLSRSEALRIYTANGAYVTFWEDRIGSIEPGKLADLVILSDNIMEIPEDRIPETKVLATLVGGRPVYDTGLFLI